MDMRLRYISMSYIKDMRIGLETPPFRLDMSPIDVLVPALKLLAGQLEMVSANLDHLDVDMKKIYAAWDKCVNLRQLKFVKCTVQQVQAVMSTPKINL